MIIACIHARLALPWNNRIPSVIKLMFLIYRATNVTLFPRVKIHFVEIFSSYDVSCRISNIYRDESVMLQLDVADCDIKLLPRDVSCGDSRRVKKWAP